MANAVSDSTFEQEVLKSTEPVLVDFFAEWCGPCKAMAPALEQVALEMRGKVKVVKLDVDQNPTVTGKYGIRANSIAPGYIKTGMTGEGELTPVDKFFAAKNPIPRPGYPADFEGIAAYLASDAS